ncbi:family 78 glycoside hydrolase catalytic domain [Microbacterium sp.]|uniref:family 78 glycoside hydrolase catalytic domain n=1 Tax=Microbacterium sp. TaxID=51671 RepID=UPI00334258B1
MNTLVRSLRLGHAENTLGGGEPSPPLTWTVTTDDPEWRQEEVEIVATGADEVQRIRLRTTAQVRVPWPFRPLRSRERVSVRVRVGQDGAWSTFSAPSAYETGLLREEDWTAKAITPHSLGRIGDPAPIVFSSFQLPRRPTIARLYVTALGVYDVAINGIPVTDEVLAPGWTPYRERLAVQTYDVTALIREGENEVQAVLGNGWYRGQLVWEGNRALYGDRLGLLAQLEMTDAAGLRTVVGTDPLRWRATASGILADDLYDGQSTDMRVPDTIGERQRAESEEVDGLDLDLGILVPRRAPAVRATEVRRALSVHRTAEGRTIADFGQNLVGWVRLVVRGGTAGDRIAVRHAEVLEDGELCVRPLRSARATASYLLSGRQEETLEPRFTFSGFRYAEIDGVDDVDPADVSAVVIGTDLRRTGWFECSDPRLNRLHENVVWSTRGNFLSIPTDCPQRDERLGWTGDIQVFAPTAAFLFDVDGFLADWLESLAIEQYDDGSMPFIVPHVLGPDDVNAAGWGDAATLVPFALHERYADADVLRRQYDSMRRWVDCVQRLAGPSLRWETGFQFGDWLDPSSPADDAAAAQADPAVVATAYFYRSTRLLARTAGILGHHDQEQHYDLLADRIRCAFLEAYVTPLGRVMSDCQTVYALALQFDLLTDSAQRAGAGARLAELVAEAGHRVSTGFLGTPHVLDALTETGHADVAFRMLTATESPSWLFPVTMGATTIWERWDSLLPDGSVNPGEMTSFNHYAYGAVADWIHRRIGGVTALDPGFSRFRIGPFVRGELTHASTRLECPYGEISVSWRRDRDRLELEATVPVGTIAEVHLPDSREPVVVGHGVHRFSAQVRRIEADESMMRADLQTVPSGEGQL